MFITAKLAKQIVGHQPLPKTGRERLVSYEGARYWLSQTLVEGMMKWWLRYTDSKPQGS